MSSSLLQELDLADLGLDDSGIGLLLSRTRPGSSRRRQREAAVLWQGKRTERTFLEGPHSTDLETLAHVTVEDGTVQLVVTVFSDDEVHAKPSVVLDAPIDLLTAYRALNVIELLDKIDSDGTYLADALQAVLLEADGLQEADSDDVQEYAFFREEVGAEAFDRAVKAFPPEGIESVIKSCLDRGVKVDLDPIAQAVAAYQIPSTHFLHDRLGVERPQARQERLDAEEAFIAPLRPLFAAALIELGHKPNCSCGAAESLKATALEFRKYGLPTDLLVAVVLAQVLDAPHPLMELVSVMMPAQVKKIVGTQQMISAVATAAKVAAKVVPDARPEQALRHAVVGTTFDIAAGLLKAESEKSDGHETEEA